MDQVQKIIEAAAPFAVWVFWILAAAVLVASRMHGGKAVLFLKRVTNNGADQPAHRITLSRRVS